MNLKELAAVLMALFEWRGSHTHLFRVQGHDLRLGCSLPDVGGLDGLGDENEEDLTVQQVAPNVDDQFLWEYDMGDSWEHGLITEKVATTAELGHRHIPVCLAGAKCGPPENAGGIERYNHLVKQHKKGERDSDYDEEFDDWAEDALGFPFDPNAFSLRDKNAELRELRLASAIHL